VANKYILLTYENEFRENKIEYFLIMYFVSSTQKSENERERKTEVHTQWYYDIYYIIQSDSPSLHTPIFPLIIMNVLKF